MMRPVRDALVRRYLVYVTVVTVFTIALFAPRDGNWWQVWGFFVLALLTESMSVPFLRLSSTMSVGFALIHAAVLLFDPLQATWIAAFGTVRSRDLQGAVPLSLIAYNRLQLGAAAYAASNVFRLLGGDLSHYGSLLSIGAGIGSGLTYFVVNAAFVLLSFAVVQRLPNWRRTFITGFKWVAVNWVIVLPIAYLIAVGYKNIGFLSIVFYGIPLMAARQSFQMYVEARKQYVDTLRSLATALEARDPYIFGHAERVARLAVEVGREMKLPPDDLEALEVAAILHDVGKIGVADAILCKAGRYTPSDRAEMQKHPVIGAKIVANVKALGPVADWIRHHHERFDGTGYPDQLQGTDIPLGARIIAVVDAFDAITSERPYRRAKSTAEALAELERCAGQQFDAEVVAAFRRAVADGTELDTILAGASELTAELIQNLERDFESANAVVDDIPASAGTDG